MNNKRYAKLDTLIAVYDERRNSVSLLGERGQFHSGFQIRLKRGTPEDVVIREILFKSEVDALVNFSGPMFYPEDLPPRLHHIPLGKDADNNEVNWNFGGNGVSSLLVTGNTASGKTMMLKHIAEILAEYYGEYSDIYFLDEGLRSAGEDVSNVKTVLSHIEKTLNNQQDYSVPTFLLIDELPYLLYSDKEIEQQLLNMLAMSRSRNLHIIFAAQSSRQVGRLKDYCQEVRMDNVRQNSAIVPGELPPVRRYGMFVSSEETQVFAPYLPQSFKNQ